MGSEMCIRDRFSAVVIGSGLGTGGAATAFVRTVLASVEAPAVIDGDGLAAIVGHFDTVAASDFPTVLTPHDGEYERLLGRRPGPDRIGAAAELADATEAVVVLKGPTTVVAEPGGRTLLAISGDSRLATAGTGDVLAGMIGALLAQGVPVIRAAAAAAHLHGRAGALGPAVGLIAGDLPDLIPEAIRQVTVD